VLVQIFALLTNDAAAILFGTFCTRTACRALPPADPRALLLTGIVIGLRVTKLSVLVYVPAAES
jgi:multisubunit Na+/H+ antiporter MnhC subunit